MFEAMTQTQNARNHDIDMMVQSLRSHCLASSDVTNHSVRAEESCFGKQVSISEQSFELAQTPNFGSDIDSLTSYPFSEIELKNEYDHEPQFSDSILLPDSIMTPVSSPNVNLFFESTWILCQFLMKLNRPSLMIILLNLTNFILLKVPLTNWQVLIFMTLNSMRNVT